MIYSLVIKEFINKEFIYLLNECISKLYVLDKDYFYSKIY